MIVLCDNFGDYHIICTQYICLYIAMNNLMLAIDCRFLFWECEQLVFGMFNLDIANDHKQLFLSVSLMMHAQLHYKMTSVDIWLLKIFHAAIATIY